MYGIYKEPIPKRKVSSSNLILCEEYPEEYFSYIDNIESYISTNMCPSNSEKQEFGHFDSSMRDEHCWNPNRYNKTATKIRTALKQEKTVSLSDIATIIRPRPDKNKKHAEYHAMPGTWQYPVDYAKFRTGTPTDCPLQKGDIVFLDGKKMFLVYDEPKEIIHTSPNCFVIRPTKISSEYLYIYLNSDTAQIVIDLESYGAVIRRIRKSDLEKLQIILPEKDPDYYKSIFYANNFPINDIVNLNKAILNTSGNTGEDSIEDILDLELVNKLRVYKQDLKEKILDEDLKEINICFKHKAYKAALILAGSILEAVLIDWLSELHGKIISKSQL